MSVSLTVTVDGETIGAALADDYEDAAEAIGALADRITSEDDLYQFTDALTGIGWRDEKKAQRLRDFVRHMHERLNGQE